MDQIMNHAKIPIRMTYRAIGSGNGQKEFMVEPAITDFGSGDIPLKTADRSSFLTTLQEANLGNDQKILHLPVVLGAISFFHTLPEGKKLNLDACTTAKIFSGDITNYNDPAIVAMNPDLGITRPIRVVRRADGSSSTSSITQYLNVACEGSWPAEKVGKSLSVEQWGDHTIACSGSGGVSTCLNDEEGSFGYLEAGHGRGEGFGEVHLKNPYGRFVTSAMASENDGIAAAASSVNNADLPSDATADFGSVHFINKNGEYTWPIVAMSYVYVRQDISYINDPVAEGLLIAWLKALYQGDYIQQCVTDFGFTKVSGSAYDIAMAGIDSIITSNDSVKSMWTFEEKSTSMTNGMGMGDYVISSKRNTFSDVQIEVLDEETKLLLTDVDTLYATINELTRQLEVVKNQATQLSTGQNSIEADLTEQKNTNRQNEAMTSATTTIAVEPVDDQRLDVAFALSIISFILWAVFILYVIASRVCFAHDASGTGNGAANMN